MDAKIIIYIIIIVSLGLAFFYPDKVEGHNGALVQLVAKGPQDTYLTGDAWKYYPWWFNGAYDYPYRYAYAYPYNRRGFWFPGRYTGKYPYYRRFFW